MRQPKVWISFLILLILGLHVVPVISWQGHRQTRWPFLNWAMYAKSHPPGPVQATLRRAFVATASGAEEEVTPRMAGLPWPALRNIYLAPLLKNDSSVVPGFFAQLNRHRRDAFVAVRLVTERATLSDTGIVRDTLPTITYRIDPAAEVPHP